MSTLPLAGLRGRLFRHSGQGILADNTTDYCPFATCRLDSSGNVLLNIGGCGGSLMVISVFGSTICGGTGVTVVNASNTNGAFALRLVTLQVEQGKARIFVVTPLGKRRFLQTYEGANNRFVRVSPTSGGYVGIVRVHGASGSISTLLSNIPVRGSRLTTGVRRLRVFFDLLVPSVARRRQRLLSRTLVGACGNGNVARSGSSLRSPSGPKRCERVPVLNSLCSVLITATRAGELTGVLGHLIRNSTDAFGRHAGIGLRGGCAILSVSRLSNSLLATKVFITLSCM